MWAARKYFPRGIPYLPAELLWLNDTAAILHWVHKLSLLLIQTFCFAFVLKTLTVYHVSEKTFAAVMCRGEKLTSIMEHFWIVLPGIFLDELQIIRILWWDCCAKWNKRNIFYLRYDSKRLCDEYSTVFVSCTGLFAHKIGEFKFVVLRLCPGQPMRCVYYANV